MMGAPGAGKGTQSAMLAREIGYKQFSTGDAFREVSRQDSDLGRRVKHTIDNGILGPPEMAAEIVMEAVKKHIEAGDGLIFDGTPRTVAEAGIVDKFFEEQEYGRPLVVYLRVDKDEMIERSLKRKFCMGIKGDFPVANEEDEKRCEEKGGTVGRRPDDEPDKLGTRWDEFSNRTMPVVNKYRDEKILNEIDAYPPIADVHEKIMELVNSLK